MKRLFLLLTLITLFCTSTFAEQREKLRTATEYTKFFAQRVKNYASYRVVSQEELRKEFRNERKLYEININYFGSILHKNKILTLKKFMKELPESGKVAYVVTVDRKQEFQRVYFEVLDAIYEYLYGCRKKSKLPNEKLDQEIPYFVICIAKGRYDEKIVPNVDTTLVAKESEFEKSPIVADTDRVVEVVAPKERPKVVPKKKAKVKTVVEPQIVPKESDAKEGIAKAPILFMLGMVILLIVVVLLKEKKKRNSKK